MVVLKQFSRIIGALMLISTFLAVVATVQLEAGNAKKPFKAAKQAKLDQMGDLAIRNLESEMAESDLHRILLLRESIGLSSPQVEWAEIQFVVPKGRLIRGAVMVMRLELKAYYLGRITIDQDQFEQTFKEKLLNPCKQLDAHLNSWWQEARKGIYSSADSSRFDMLVAENACRILIGSVGQGGDFTLLVRREFDHSLNQNVVEMLELRPNESHYLVESVSQSLQPTQLDRLLFLRKCIGHKTYNYHEHKIKAEQLVKGLAKFMILDDELESEEDKTILEQKINEKFIEPCKRVRFWSDSDISASYGLEKIAVLCKIFQDLGFDKRKIDELITKTNREIHIQLLLENSKLKLKREETQSLLLLY